MNNTKEEYAYALGTLLSLDRVLIQDLKNLELTTLAKMYTNYVQNAKDVNNKMEKLAGIMQTRPKKLSTKTRLGIVYNG
jgi:aromatic ring-opening dioxygenase LigB subunit